MFDEPFIEQEPDWTDDVLGNFSPDEWAVIDKGYESEVTVLIIGINQETVTVRDECGQQYEVNVLRLSKP